MATRFSILCIDNFDDRLHTMHAALLRAGHQVHVAIGGRNGLSILADLPAVDIILVNHDLFDMRALSVVSQIASTPGLQSAGIVYHCHDCVLNMPTHSPAWSRVDVCLPAPFRPGDLYDAVFEAYTRRRGYLYSLSL